MKLQRTVAVPLTPLHTIPCSCSALLSPMKCTCSKTTSQLLTPLYFVSQSKLTMALVSPPEPLEPPPPAWTVIFWK